MKITEISFTAYAVTDVKRARNFYEKILGLTASSVFEKDSMAFIEYEIGAHTLSIGSGAPAFVAGPTGGVVAFEVDDFAGMLEGLKAEKVKFIMDAHDTGVCQMALIEDPDGNRVMIHHRKSL